MPDRPWPHPPTIPGARVVHSWRCTRREAIEQTTKRDPVSGAIIECEACSECAGTDMSWRLQHPELGGDAA